ncbi:hypothetical protein Aoki45_13970 [Algoriphagus sp. oki45]|uniref:hypothetical protein n=1 Tax=Algoriphagus sp. oki45 TaxID=3067294 RepID=UPI0027E798F2|nr:hypothetical protein Aoki45_13970 [Algoriphagus sp. oki45]
MKNSLKYLLGIDPNSLILPAILGALVPTSLLTFLILANTANYSLWMILPLLIIPTGGAAGGIFFYLMGFHWFPKGNQKLIAIIVSILVYFVIVWLSSVITFNFTGHWN